MNALMHRFKKSCLLLVSVTALIAVLLQFRASQHTFLLSFNDKSNFSSLSFSFDKFMPLLQPVHWSKSKSKEKITHVNFLKVHKAGSTTVQNMMLRFGIRYGLNILLPKKGNYFGSKANAVKIPPTEHFDIFAIHTIYDQSLMDGLLPNDTLNIGIVREPVDRFVSAAYYYRDVFPNKHLLKVPHLSYIHELVKHPDKYETEPFSTTKNAMARDFGFKADFKLNETDRISNYLEYLDKQFSLVMVVERFDESLILLKRILNWSHLDIVYLKSNSNAHKPIVLSPPELTMLRTTCFLDFTLYEHFKKRFEDMVSRESDDFQDEVNHFRNILTNVKDFCDKPEKGDVLHVDKSAWYDRFILTRTECTRMNSNELKFIAEIRNEQYKRHNITSPSP